MTSSSPCVRFWFFGPIFGTRPHTATGNVVYMDSHYPQIDGTCPGYHAIMVTSYLKIVFSQKSGLTPPTYGGGGGVLAYHFGTNYFELGVGLYIKVNVNAEMTINWRKIGQIPLLGKNIN